MLNEINQGQNSGAQFDDEIDLFKLLGILLDGRYIIAAFVTMFATLAVLYALVLDPIYRANSFILIEKNAQGIPGLDDTAAIIASETSVVQELHLLKTRMVMGSVVDELDLTTHASPIYLPLIGAALARRHTGAGPADAVFGLESYAWGGEKVRVSYLQVPRSYLGQPLELVALDEQQFSLYHHDEELLTGTVGEKAFALGVEIQILVDSLTARPGTRFEVRKSGRFDAMLNLQSTLSVSEKGKGTGIIEIALEGADRDYILEIVDSVTSNFYRQSMQRLSSEAESTLDFLEQQILGVKADLSSSEEALNDFRSERVSVDLSLEAKAALDSLVQIEADINAMSISEVEISRRFTQAHPSYISFKRQLENLQEQRNKLRAKLSQLPDTQKRILRLTRDFEAHKAIFVSLDSRRQELSMLKASRKGSVRLMDEAVVLPNIVAPKRSLIAILGTLLGGMLGIMIVLLRSFMKAGIIDQKTFTGLGLTVHATIPYSDNQLSVGSANIRPRHFLTKKIKTTVNYNLLANDSPDDSAIEALRSFRTCLRFLMSDSKNNRVMISSASPGVGKSFVSVNLATLFANSGLRVLIVDADMRRSYLHRTFGVKSENGLAETLAGTMSVREVIRRTTVDNLHFIPRGKVPSNPSELLMRPMFAKISKELSEEYDLIFFDTPPILAVTDASIVGLQCDTNMMVARFGVCTKTEINAAKIRFELNGSATKGVIFNAVEKKTSGYYYDDAFLFSEKLGDYQKLPAMGRSNMADRKNLLTPEELDALLKIN
jgi:tyrosine-protein kinase Etk/Wzc